MHTRWRIFSWKSTRKRLAAGLCPDPLRELKRSPRPSSREKRKGKEKGREKEGEGEGRDKRKRGIQEG